MNVMRRALLLFALIVSPLAWAPPDAQGANPDPKSLDVPPAVAAEAKDLAKKLGSLNSPDRQRAALDLRKLGRLALPALVEALRDSEDAEVRKLIETILAAAREDDLRARIDCFVADGEGKFDHKLPGAKEFLGVTGTSEVALKLFREIQLSPNRELFAAFSEPRELAVLIDARKTKLFGTDYRVTAPPKVADSPTVVDFAAIYFAESTMPEKKLGERPNYGVAQRLSHPVLVATFKNGPEKEAVEKILAKWTETRLETGTLAYAIHPLTILQPELGANAAVRLLGMKDVTAFQRERCMTTIARYSGEKRIALLLPLLKDDSHIYEDSEIAVGGNHHEIRTRDLALVYLLAITKQNVEDYGLTIRPTYKGRIKPDDFNAIAQYFDGDDKAKKREAAFKKWDAWYEKNKDSLKK
jgi:hypothetical protein